MLPPRLRTTDEHSAGLLLVALCWYRGAAKAVNSWWCQLQECCCVVVSDGIQKTHCWNVGDFKWRRQKPDRHSTVVRLYRTQRSSLHVQTMWHWPSSSYLLYIDSYCSRSELSFHCLNHRAITKPGSDQQKPIWSLTTSGQYINWSDYFQCSRGKYGNMRFHLSEKLAGILYAYEKKEIPVELERRILKTPYFN